MKPRSRILLLSAISILAVLVLSACGTATPAATTAGDTAAPATSAPATAKPVEPAKPSPLPAVLKMPAQIAGGKPVTISVVGRPPDSQASLLAAWQASVGRFEKMYPNVAINGSDYAYNPDTFAAMVAANQIPTPVSYTHLTLPTILLV